MATLAAAALSLIAARAAAAAVAGYDLPPPVPVPTFSSRPLAASDAAPAPAAPDATSPAAVVSPAADASPPAGEVGFESFDDKQFMQARRSGSPVVLYFESDGCAPCSKMHATTFRAPAVLEAAAGIRFFRVNISSPLSYVDLIQKSFRVTGAPTVLVFGPDGTERSRRFGFISPEAFVEMLGEGRKPSQASDRKPS